MDADLIKVGSTYQCTSPLLEDIFSGKVEKLYDLSALVEVSMASALDDIKVQDLNKKLVIPFSLFDKLLTEN